METTAEFSLLNLVNGWLIEAFDTDARHPAEWAELDEQLATTQYAYIKFGLLLERIRAKKIAKAKGITVREYLTDLMDEDEESEEIESVIPLELSDLDVRVLDDLDLEFVALSGRVSSDRQPIINPIVARIAERILEMLGELYVWMRGGTAWSLY